jgi:hypothetical protein
MKSSQFLIVAAIALLIGVFVTGCGGDSSSASTGSGTSVKLTPAATTITAGQSTALTWSSIGALSLVSSSFGASGVSGSMTVSPTVTTTYTITVAGPSGNQTASTTVTVIPVVGPPVVTLSASTLTIAAGQSTILTWSSTGSATLVTSSNFGATTVAGSTTVSPTQTTTYTISVNGAGGTSNPVTVVVTVTPTVSITPPSALTINQSEQLQASVLGTTNTQVSWSALDGGSITAGGMYTAPSTPGTYHITATSFDGSVSATAAISVLATSGTVTIQ